jgi:hypothetical protein
MRQRTTDEFIKLADIKHNSRYGYEKTVYTIKDAKVIITCPIHGDFEQRANDHLRGSGCKQCSFSNINKKDTELLLRDFNKIHGDKYFYNKMNYVNTHTKIIITCPLHGDFEQTPHNHICGSGCPDCGKVVSIISRRKSIADFINEANIIHKNRYNYDLADYVNADTKIVIRCDVHGLFYQRPYAHVNGKQGCPGCYNDLRKYNSPSWKKDNWMSAGSKSKHFDSFKLYMVLCYNDNESFIKIGRTFNTVEQRFKIIPYNYKILKVIKSDAYHIFDLEYRFKKLYKKYNYIPKIKFGGRNECYVINTEKYLVNSK